MTTREWFGMAQEFTIEAETALGDNLLPYLTSNLDRMLADRGLVRRTKVVLRRDPAWWVITDEGGTWSTFPRDADPDGCVYRLACQFDDNRTSTVSG